LTLTYFFHHLTNTGEYDSFYKKMKRYIFILVVILIIFIAISPTEAFWVWTPETNKWVNPKYSVKETPGEQLKYALEFFESGEYKETIAECKKLIKHYPKAREAPEAQYHIGLSLESQGKLYPAFKAYQIVIDKYPFSELSAKIVKQQYDIGVNILGGEGVKNKIVDSFTTDNYTVIDIFRTVIINAPYGEFAAPAQYKIGLYLSEKRLFQEARDEFEKVLNDYPESEWAKAAKYQIAMSDAKRSTDAQYDQKITKVAVEGLEKFVEVYPDGQLSIEAKDQIKELREKEAKNNFIVAKFYEKQKNYKAAKMYYQVVVDDYSDTSIVRDALLKIREMSQKE